MPISDHIIEETFSEYLQRPELNASTAVWGFKSMREFKYRLDNPNSFKETKDTLLGSAAHSMLELGPVGFKDKFVVMPPYNLDANNVTGKGEESTSKSTKYYKNKVAEFNFKCMENGQESVDTATYEASCHMIESIFSHKLCADVINAARKELTIIGTVGGLPAKGRVDLLEDVDLENGECPDLSDFKTTIDISPSAFGSVVSRFSYIFKMRWYQLILKSFGVETKNVYLLACEKAGSCDRTRVPIPQQVLEQVDPKINKLLTDIQGQMALGSEATWPGQFETEDAPLEIKPWDMKEIDEIDWSEVD